MSIALLRAELTWIAFVWTGPMRTALQSAAQRETL